VHHSKVSRDDFADFALPMDFTAGPAARMGASRPGKILLVIPPFRGNFPAPL
jgi:hypothetical protein